MNKPGMGGGSKEIISTLIKRLFNIVFPGTKRVNIPDIARGRPAGEIGPDKTDNKPRKEEKKNGSEKIRQADV
jgi:hypothetical protein